MSNRRQRHPVESLRSATVRCGAIASLVALIAVGWAAIRPVALYWTACANLGNWRTEDLIRRGILVNEADQAWIAEYAKIIGAQSELEFLSASSFNNGRRRGGLVWITGGELSETDQVVAIYDQGLQRIAAVRCDGKLVGNPDDRDGDGTIEVLCRVWGVDSTRWAVVRAGQKQNSLIAVIEFPYSLPGSGPEFMWVNVDGDETHELALDPTNDSNSSPAPKFLLRWASPGRMVLDGDLLEDCKLWLANTKDEVTFGQDQSLDAVVRRVMGNR